MNRKSTIKIKRSTHKFVTIIVWAPDELEKYVDGQESEYKHDAGKISAKACGKYIRVLTDNAHKILPKTYHYCNGPMKNSWTLKNRNGWLHAGEAWQRTSGECLASRRNSTVSVTYTN